MDLQQAYTKIDELYSQYIECDEVFRKNTIKSKLLKIICDVVNSDYKYKSHIENGDFDYLPILTATNDAIKSFSNKGHFHSYLFKSINRAIKKDFEENERKGINLNYSNIQELKRIKKLLELYNYDKEKLVRVLDISKEKIEALLLSEKIDYFSNHIQSSDSELTVEDILPASKYETIEIRIVREDDINKLLNTFDSAWKDLKVLHQEIISDWLTNITLSALETSNNISFMENKNNAFNFLFRYSYINKDIVKSFFEDKSFELSLTYESIAEKYGITKSAVYKKVQIFIDELKKYKII